MTSEGPRIRVVSAEIERSGHYLITQRRPDAVLPLLWEFPGGRVRDGEDDAATLRRTLAHRVGLDIEVGEQTMEVVHVYEGYSLTMAVYRCTADEQIEPEPHYVHDIAWVRPDQFGNYQFPGADQLTVDALLGSDQGTSIDALLANLEE